MNNIYEEEFNSFETSKLITFKAKISIWIICIGLNELIPVVLTRQQKKTRGPMM